MERAASVPFSSCQRRSAERFQDHKVALRHSCDKPADLSSQEIGIVPKADTQTVAKLLREYAQRTLLRGGNPYRSKAYSRAADSLFALAVPLDRLIAEDRLTEVPGVGEAIADIITKLHRTGTHPNLEKLRDRKSVV